MSNYAMAVDIGGTFTDVVLRGSDGRTFVDKTLTTPKSLDEGFFAAVDAVLEDRRDRARRRDRRGGACDDGRDQRGDRAQGPAHRAARHRRLPRHPHHPRRASLRDVRSADRVSRAADRARDDVRRRRARAGDRRGAQADRRRADRSDRGRSEAQGRRLGRGLAAQRLSQSGERARHPRHHPQARARPVCVDLVRRRAADPRISAHLDGGDERLHGADHRAVSRRAAPRAEAARLRPRSADHAEQWRRDRHRRRQALSGAHGRVRSGRGRARGVVFRRSARARPAALVRHGRHHRESLHHRGPQPARGRQLRGRSHLSLQVGQRPADPHSLGRHDRDRRRRRQHRVGQRSRPPESRPAKRRLDAGPGVLRPRRQEPDRDRCGSRARVSQRRQFPRRRHEARSRRRAKAARRTGEGARHLDGRGRLGHLSRRRRVDDRGRARACDRPRHRLSRPAAVRVRRGRAGACVLRRRAARQPGRDLSAARERALGLRHPGDAAAARSRARRAVAALRARLGARSTRCSPSWSPMRATVSPAPAASRPTSRCASAPTCATSASRTK